MFTVVNILIKKDTSNFFTQLSTIKRNLQPFAYKNVLNFFFTVKMAKVETK